MNSRIENRELQKSAKSHHPSGQPLGLYCPLVERGEGPWASFFPPHLLMLVARNWCIVLYRRVLYNSCSRHLLGHRNTAHTSRLSRDRPNTVFLKTEQVHHILHLIGLMPVTIRISYRLARSPTLLCFTILFWGAPEACTKCVLVYLGKVKLLYKGNLLLGYALSSRIICSPLKSSETISLKSYKLSPLEEVQLVFSL